MHSPGKIAVKDPPQSSTGPTNHDGGIDPSQPGSQSVEVGLDCEFLQSADHITYAPNEDAYRLQYDPAVDEPSLAVVAVVAAITHQTPTDLSPLYGAVDPKALDAVVSSVKPNSTLHSSVSFLYHGFAITIIDCDTIEVTPT